MNSSLFQTHLYFCRYQRKKLCKKREGWLIFSDLKHPLFLKSVKLINIWFQRILKFLIYFYPPASKGSKGGSKFNWKKKSTYPCIWCQRICLSVVNSDPNYLRTGKTEWAKQKFRTSMAKTHTSKNFICPKSGR